MGEVAFTVHGRTYQVSCEDGQEGHVQSLAERIDGHVRDLSGQLGQVGDARLLVMASLMIADEAHDLRGEIDELRAALEQQSSRGEDALADAMESVAERIERLADGLEGA